MYCSIAKSSGVFLLCSAGLYVLMVFLLALANWRMRKAGGADTEVDAEPQQLERFLEKQLVVISR